MKIMIINGPNMNLLGIREPGIYGKRTYSDLCAYICEKFPSDTFTFRQSNHEGDLVDYIQEALQNYDGIVINPAAYTHTSIAIPDALKAIGVPAVEVHVSDIFSREDYRRISYTKDAVITTISGKGFDGYIEAVSILKNAGGTDD